jgi:DNA-directed RNA polymerase specialized sigma24 family protein
MIAVTAPATDADLLTRAQRGERDAFGELFERHAPAVLRFCFRRTGNAALAEDLMSTVFLEAWRRRDRTVSTATTRVPGSLVSR